jgi:hypothetical protein
MMLRSRPRLKGLRSALDGTDGLLSSRTNPCLGAVEDRRMLVNTLYNARSGSLSRQAFRPSENLTHARVLAEVFPLHTRYPFHSDSLDECSR